MREKIRYKLSGPDCGANVFVFIGSIIICRLETLTFSDQTQLILRQSVSLFNTQKIFLAALLGGPKKQHFFTGPEPALGSPL